MAKTTETAGDRPEWPGEREARWERERAAEDRQALERWSRAAEFLGEDIYTQLLDGLFDGANGEAGDLRRAMTRLGDVDWMLTNGHDHYAEIGRIVVDKVHRHTVQIVGDFFVSALQPAFWPGDEGREAWERMESHVARWREQAKAARGDMDETR